MNAVADMIGPVELTPITTKAQLHLPTEERMHRGECRECVNGFIAADRVSAEAMANRHWLIGHPEWKP